ncbi:hypothetical protein MAR_003415 [Mya arenaria]|uniref:Uncharacterized protein n=1 Tax=Mya arenaria TaxID=6604 RepID=A0ABY7G925_MYAAR|nr:hypothetical protein MAR_003415 [Mya arenaria]
MWETVERSFNVQSTGIHRTVDLLTKKWDNLTQVHRPKFMDYKRQLHLTDLTNAVIDVIGRDGCAMDGIGGSEEFDSTCIQESQSRSDVGLNSQPVYQFVNDYTTYQPVLEAEEVPAMFHLSRPEASTISKACSAWVCGARKGVSSPLLSPSRWKPCGMWPFSKRLFNELSLKTLLSCTDPGQRATTLIILYHPSKTT